MGKCEYGTILQLIIQLIHFTVCSCIYRICSDRTWGKYEYGTILQLIIHLIHFTVCSCIYSICSDRTLGKYEYGTILQFIKLYSNGQEQNNVQYKDNITINIIISINTIKILLILCYGI